MNSEFYTLYFALPNISFKHNLKRYKSSKHIFQTTFSSAFTLLNIVEYNTKNRTHRCALKYDQKEKIYRYRYHFQL
jgi:hypothetical protein